MSYAGEESFTLTFCKEWAADNKIQVKVIHPDIQKAVKITWTLNGPGTLSIPGKSQENKLSQKEIFYTLPDVVNSEDQIEIYAILTFDSGKPVYKGSSYLLSTIPEKLLEASSCREPSSPITDEPSDKSKRSAATMGFHSDKRSPPDQTQVIEQQKEQQPPGKLKPSNESITVSEDQSSIEKAAFVNPVSLLKKEKHVSKPKPKPPKPSVSTECLTKLSLGLPCDENK